ncbi:ParA family protein [Bifidobacterium pseudocatenulatum]|uniref:ParA family protein n=1 Tax=Bifidobacterium pseudocatenulatum TaxID=28026 RepID=UPI003D03A71D
MTVKPSCKQTIKQSDNQAIKQSTMPTIRRMVPNPRRKHHASSVGEQAGDPLPFDVLPANMATLAYLGGAPATKEWSIIDAPPQGPLLDKTLAVADFVILPTSDSPMDLQQAWDTLDRARHATRAALLPVRVEANTNAWAQTLATLEQTDTARFDTFIAKRQPIKTSLGMNPKQLYEYRELADELTRIAKEELA